MVEHSHGSHNTVNITAPGFLSEADLQHPITMLCLGYRPAMQHCHYKSLAGSQLQHLIAYFIRAGIPYLNKWPFPFARGILCPVLALPVHLETHLVLVLA